MIGVGFYRGLKTNATSKMKTYNTKNGNKIALSYQHFSKNDVVGVILGPNPFPFLESILYIASTSRISQVLIEDYEA